MALILFITLIILAFIYYHFYYKLKGLPPGPMPLPIIGNLLQLNRDGTPEVTLLKWRRQYGPVFTFWLGNLPMVVIADYQKMVETFVRDADNYVDRYNFPFEEAFRGDSAGNIHGVISSSGQHWREQRRFALHKFRDFGLGKNMMQERILDEIMAMFDKLEAQMSEHREVELLECIDLAIGSIINNLMFGYRFDKEKEAEFFEIKGLVDEHFKKFGNPLALIWLLYYKIVDHIPPFKQVGQGFRHRLDFFVEFFRQRIVEHQKDFDNDQLEDTMSDEPKDFVEAFLKEMRRKELANEQGHHFNLTQLSNMCFDLWIAGQETSSNLLSWEMAFLLNYPECLAKLHAELDRIIGTDRPITVSDRPNLHYTNAVICETLRCANLFPFNMRRVTANDTILDGYNLPKGTCIVPEISVLLCDDSVFPEADKFKPERFLDDEGKFQKCDQLVVFSLGKRQCLGESLARMELFLFTANLHNKYKIMVGDQVPSLERINAAVVRCPNYKCRMEKRK